jgi:hypothetical protein
LCIAVLIAKRFSGFCRQRANRWRICVVPAFLTGNNQPVNALRLILVDDSRARACELIPALTDPVSGQPKSKFARVPVVPVGVFCRGLPLSREIPPVPELRRMLLAGADDEVA